MNMVSKNIGFCMLIEVDTLENTATYEDFKRAMLVTLKHDEKFIEYLSRQIEDEQLCYWIDLDEKKNINKEL